MKKLLVQTLLWILDVIYVAVACVYAYATVGIVWGFITARPEVRGSATNIFAGFLADFVFFTVPLLFLIAGIISGIKIIHRTQFNWLDAFFVCAPIVIIPLDVYILIQTAAAGLGGGI